MKKIVLVALMALCGASFGFASHPDLVKCGECLSVKPDMVDCVEDCTELDDFQVKNGKPNNESQPQESQLQELQQMEASNKE